MGKTVGYYWYTVWLVNETLGTAGMCVGARIVAGTTVVMFIYCWLVAMVLPHN